MSKVFSKSSKAKKKIMIAQRREIEKLYKDWADEIGKMADWYAMRDTASSIISTRYYRELQSQLKKTAREVTRETDGIIKKNIYLISDSVIKDNAAWLASFGFASNKVSGAFSYVPNNVIFRLTEGKVYKSGWNLSNKIWGDNQKTLSDIYKVMSRGVAQQKPIYEIAKDLEKYVRPNAMLDWNLYMADGVKLYKKKIDYNAQRLARTLVQHSYQLSIEEVAKDNPFVEGFIWRSNGSRACPICQDRDGRVYKKDEVPLDHPNGMCYIEPYIEKNMVDKLADWFNASKGTYPEIDKFAENFM
jgi:hypothetical protein|nr:MAG TPA: minor capsid protein [Caudoviricetes sp.]